MLAYLPTLLSSPMFPELTSFLLYLLTHPLLSQNTRIQSHVMLYTPFVSSCNDNNSDKFYNNNYINTDYIILILESADSWQK